MKKSKRIVANITVVAIVGLAGFALALEGPIGHHMSGGAGDHMMGYEGSDNHMGSGNYGRSQQLSGEQMENIDQVRKNYLNATSVTRTKAYQKQVDLRNELAKENPNAERLRVIQKDLSALEAELDQKRLEHELEIRKIAPVSSSGQGYAGRHYDNGSGSHHMD